MITAHKVNDLNYRVEKNGETIGYVTRCTLGPDPGWLFTAASRELSKAYLDTCNPVATWELAMPVDLSGGKA